MLLMELGYSIRNARNPSLQLIYVVIPMALRSALMPLVEMVWARCNYATIYVQMELFPGCCRGLHSHHYHYHQLRVTQVPKWRLFRGTHSIGMFPIPASELDVLGRSV